MNFKKILFLLFIITITFTNIVNADAEINIISNGSFEEGHNIRNNRLKYLNVLGAWNSTSFKERIPFELQYGLTSSIRASHGDVKLELDANENTSIAQRVTTLPGSDYLLQVDYTPRIVSRRRPKTIDTNAIGVYIDNKKITTLNHNKRKWKTHSFSIKATRHVTKIEFRAEGKSDRLGGLIDNVKFHDETGQNIIRNGSFENVPSSSVNNYGLSLIFPNLSFFFKSKRLPFFRRSHFEFYPSITGWFATKRKDVQRPFEIQRGTKIGGLAPFEGSSKLELDSSNNSQISQDIQLDINSKYKLKLAYSPRTSDRQSNKVIALLNGKRIAKFNGNKKGWINKEVEFLATKENNILSFRAVGKSDSYGGFLDKISLTKLTPSDTISPLLEVDHLNITTTNDSNFMLSIAAQDESEVTTYIYNNDNLINEKNSKVFDYTIVLAQGNNNITVKSVDTSGNVSQTHQVQTIFLDSISPIISSVTPINNTNTNINTFKLEGSSNEALHSIFINDQEFLLSGANTFTIDQNLLTQGSNSFSFYAVDLFSNISLEQIININLDTIAPTLSVLDKDRILSADSKYLLDITSDDAHFSKVEITQNGNLVHSTQTKNFTYQASLFSGENTFIIKSFDTYGNQTIVEKKINTTNFPQASLVASKLTGEIPLEVSFDASGSTDDKAITSYYMTYTADDFYFGPDPLKNYTFTTEGSFSVNLLVRDSDGNGATAQVTVTALPSTNIPPIVDSIWYFISASGEPVQTVLGVYGHSDPDGNLVKVIWDHGDGTEIEEVLIADEPESSHTHFFNGAGTYQVKATLIDNEGGQTQIIRDITINPTQLAHHNEVITPLSGKAPLNVSFDLTDAFDIDGDITLYRYRFGDGTAEIKNTENTIVEHTFNEPGTYNVRLRLVDNDRGYSDKYVEIQVFEESSIFPETKVNYNIQIAGSNPTLSIYLNDEITLDGDTMRHFEWSFGDGTQKNTPFIDGETNNGYLEHTYSSLGEYNITCVMVSTSGERSEVMSKVVNLTENTAPHPIYSIDVIKGNSPLIVNANALKAIDIDGEITRYRWRMGDGTTYDGEQFKNVTHTYTETGKYRVELRVYDDQRAIRYARFYVYVNQESEHVGQPPVALINVNQRFGEAPFTVDFNGDHSFDPETDLPLTYEWNFDDYFSSDNISMEKNPTHNFTSGGLYFVSLKVTDVDGNQSQADVSVFVYDYREYDSQKFIILQNGELDYEFIVGDNLKNKFPIDPASITWSFGDGQYSFRDYETEHTYDAHGTYEVTLNLRDLRGNYFDIKQVLDTASTPEDDIDANFTCVFSSVTSLSCYDPKFYESQDYIINTQWQLNGVSWPYNVEESSINSYMFFHEDPFEITYTITTVSGKIVSQTKEIERSFEQLNFDFNCESTFSNALECKPIITGETAPLTFNWKIDNQEVSTAQNLVLNELSSGYHYITLSIEDTLTQKTVNQSYVVTNTLTGESNCFSSKPNLISCSYNGENNDSEIQFAWTYDGQVISTDKNFTYRIQDNITSAEVRLDITLSANTLTKNINVIMAEHFREAQMLCTQSSSSTFSCNTTGSYSTTNSFTQKWYIDGALLTTENSVIIPFLDETAKEVRLVIDDISGSDETSINITLSNEFEEDTASHGSVSILTNTQGFNPVSKSISFQINDVNIKRDVEGSIIVPDLLINDNDNIINTFTYENGIFQFLYDYPEGQNKIVLRFIDENSKYITSEFTMINGSGEVVINQESTSGNTSLDLYLPNNNQPFYTIEDQAAGTVYLINVPKEDLIILAKNNSNVHSLVYRKQNTITYNLDYGVDIPLNTESGYIDDINKWMVTEGDLVAIGNSLELRTDSEGNSKISTRITVDDNKSVRIPFYINSKYENAISFVRMTNPETGETYIETFGSDFIDAHNSNHQLDLRSKIFSGASEIIIEFVLNNQTQDELSQSILIKLIDTFINSAYAKDNSSLTLKRLVFYEGVTYSNPRLLDNQQYDIGEPLFNIVSGPFPDAYDYVAKVRQEGYVLDKKKVFSVRLDANHNVDTTILDNLDHFLEICPIEDNHPESYILPKCLRKKAMKCNYDTEKISCIFNFEEGFLKYQTNQVGLFFYSEGSTEFVTDYTQNSYEENSKRAYYSKVLSANKLNKYKFNTIISMTKYYEKFILESGTPSRNYRYGNPRGSNELDGYDGADDWVAIYQKDNIIQLLLSDDIFKYGDWTPYSLSLGGVQTDFAYPLFDDISSAGHSKKSTLTDTNHFGHAEHNNGLDIDLRFTEETSLKDHTQIIKYNKMIPTIDKLEDANAVLDILNFPSIKSVYMMNDAFIQSSNKISSLQSKIKKIQELNYALKHKKGNHVAEHIFAGGDNNDGATTLKRSFFNSVIYKSNHGNHLHLNLKNNQEMSYVTSYDLPPYNQIEWDTNDIGQHQFHLIPSTENKYIYNYILSPEIDKELQDKGYKKNHRLYFYREIPLMTSNNDFNNTYKGWKIIPSENTNLEENAEERFFYIEDDIIKPNPHSLNYYKKRLEDINILQKEENKYNASFQLLNFEFRAVSFKDINLLDQNGKETGNSDIYRLSFTNKRSFVTAEIINMYESSPEFSSTNNLLTTNLNYFNIRYSYKCNPELNEYWNGIRCETCGNIRRDDVDTVVQHYDFNSLVYNSENQTCFTCATRDISDKINNICNYPTSITPSLVSSAGSIINQETISSSSCSGSLTSYHYQCKHSITCPKGTFPSSYLNTMTQSTFPIAIPYSNANNNNYTIELTHNFSLCSGDDFSEKVRSATETNISCVWGDGSDTPDLPEPNHIQAHCQ